MATIKEPILVVSSALGIYIPQTFIQQANEGILKQVPQDVKDALLEGPDHEHYWECYEELLDISFKIGRQKFFLFPQEDLWLVPLCFTRTKAWQEW